MITNTTDIERQILFSHVLLCKLDYISSLRGAFLEIAKNEAYEIGVSLLSFIAWMIEAALVHLSILLW